MIYIQILTLCVESNYISNVHVNFVAMCRNVCFDSKTSHRPNSLLSHKEFELQR